MPDRLDDGTIDRELEGLEGWERRGGAIERGFEFKDFDEALAFVNRVGAEAQTLDHHPDILMHDWNGVRVTCSTHSAKGITDHDIELARRINALNS